MSTILLAFRLTLKDHVIRMSGGYTKLFSSILDSTVWGLSKEARLLWITILCKQNRDHVVDIPIPGLARCAQLTLDETEKGLAELMRPDSYSKTPDHEGRRILKVPEGWFVVNGKKYRDMLKKEERKAYKASKEKERRERKKPHPECHPIAGEIANENEMRRKALAEEG